MNNPGVLLLLFLILGFVLLANAQLADLRGHKDLKFGMYVGATFNLAVAVLLGVASFSS